MDYYESNRDVRTVIYQNGEAMTVGEIVDMIHVLQTRAADAESVIASINSLRDKAYEEVKAERDRCVKALREIERHYGYVSVENRTSTLGDLVRQVLRGCPNCK